MTSPGSAGLLLLTLLVMLISSHQTAAAYCVEKSSAVWNNVDETTTESKEINSAPNATGVVLTGEETEGSFDVSQYFTASIRDGKVFLTPKPELSGIMDYPNTKSSGKGACKVTCYDTTEDFTVTVTIKDANTATPQMSQQTFLGTVVENFPINVPIAELEISASDNDRDSNNNELTFSLDDSSMFTLLPATQTSTSPATYSTQLMLSQPLDWSLKAEYRLTVTATDPGGQKNSSDVIITVTDMDDKTPVFNRAGYTAEALDPKALGPLTVQPEGISASDPDLGGPLQYTLIDLPEASWTQYFSLDPDTAELSLAKEIPVEVATLSEISFVVEVKETNGKQFVSRTVLVIYLTPQPGEESSDVGYIVGLAVLGVALVVVMVAAVVLYRRGKRPTHPTGIRRSDSDWESATTKRVAAADHPGQRKPERQPTPPPTGPTRYENLGYQPDQSVTGDKYTVESDHLQNSAAAAEMSPQPAPETHLYPSLDTPSETDHTSQPISDSRAPSAQPMSADAEPAPPMGARPDDVSVASQPMGGEDSAPPEEPRPDYAAKSVGFSNTVVCVTPVEAADVMEVEDDDDEELGGEDAGLAGEDEEEREDGGEGGEEEVRGRRDSDAGEEDRGSRKSEEEEDSDENDMM